MMVALCAAAGVALAACTGTTAAPTTTGVVASSVSTPSETSVASVTASSTTTAPTTTETTVAPPITSEAPQPRPVDPLVGGDPSPNVLVAVKIENTFAGRQWGVAAADVVYVEMVEGNLSRLMALFHTSFPGEVGPVRSVRSTDPDVLTAYGTPALMFSGGAGGPLDNFGSSGLINASPETIGAAYWRSSAAAAPYNLHADVNRVASGLPGIGVPRSPGFQFGADYPAMATQRMVSTVAADFANPLSFRWSDGLFHYIRKGTVQTDAATGETLAFTNLLVQHVSAQKDGTIDPVGSPSYKSFTVGNGRFTLYRDGRAIDGTWNRADAGSPTSYTDANGAPVLLRPGKTWVVLAPDAIAVTER